MVAGINDLIIEKGETWNPTWVYKIDGSGVDLSTYTARMKIKETIGGTLIKELTTDDGSLTLTGSGHITPLISATETAAITQSRGVYDLELVNGAVITKLLKGGVTFNSEVTD